MEHRWVASCGGSKNLMQEAWDGRELYCVPLCNMERLVTLLVELWLILSLYLSGVRLVAVSVLLANLDENAVKV